MVDDGEITRLPSGDTVSVAAVVVTEPPEFVKVAS